MNRIIITGGAGFIGSNFARHMHARHPQAKILVVDKFTYAGSLLNLAELLKEPNVEVVQMDICNLAVGDVLQAGDVVVHFAAESHVDRSILNASEFIRTNVLGTQNLLEQASRKRVARFVHISTDEVYGSIAAGSFTERSPIQPSSPYAASKAGADLLVKSYQHTYGFPAVITRCSNNYGPFQFPEKLIPVLVQRALADQPLPLYGTGANVRNWIHVEDHCTAIELVLVRGVEGEVYNIGGPSEHSNVEVAALILSLLGKPLELIKFVAERPGHDFRYSIDSSKLQAELGWEPAWNFGDGLRTTVDWYLHNKIWANGINNPEHKEFFHRNYYESGRLRAAAAAAAAK